MHSTHCSSDHSKVVKWEIGGVWAELDRRGTPFPLHQYCTNCSLANVPLCGWNAIVRYENLDAVCGRKLATGDDSYQLDFWNTYLWILNQQWQKNSQIKLNCDLASGQWRGNMVHQWLIERGRWWLPWADTRLEGMWPTEGGYWMISWHSY